MSEARINAEFTQGVEAMLFLTSLFFWDIRWQIALGFIWGIDTIAHAIRYGE